MHTIAGIIIALIIFGLLVTVHEGGHFLTAKASGIRVNEFSIGMGPSLFKRKRGDTEYSLRLLPIGGFVAMEGELADSDDSAAFSSKPALIRILVIAAGPFMNFLMAFILLTGLAIFATHDPVAGIKAGFNGCVYIEKLLLESLRDVFTGNASIDDFSGPVGIVTIVDETAQKGIMNLLMLTVLLSLNLGLINILPFPALDGGRILFIIIRQLTGKVITDRIENFVNFVGISLLFAFMIFITCNDISNLF